MHTEGFIVVCGEPVARDTRISLQIVSEEVQGVVVSDQSTSTFRLLAKISVRRSNRSTHEIQMPGE